jgi:GNAT superfamily N-acetyltransferase
LEETVTGLLVYDSVTELPPDYAQQARTLLQDEGFLEQMPVEADAGVELALPDLHPTYFLVVDGRTVQSYGRTIWARIEHLSQSYKLYGLGDVVTRATRRKMGYGSRVVEAATAHIHGDREADAAVLLTEPKLKALYVRYGWEHVSGMMISTSEHTRMLGVGSFPMMLFVSTTARAARTSFLTHPLVLPGDEW